MDDRVEYNTLTFKEAFPQLVQLWKSSFGDSKEFINAFFDLFEAEHHLHTLSLGSVVVSVLYALPFTISCNGKELPVAYIYAVATDEAFRGKGYMSHLMARVHTSLALNGFSAAILLPASTKLRDYYKQMGYKDVKWGESSFYKSIPALMYYPIDGRLPKQLNIHHFFT